MCRARTLHIVEGEGAEACKLVPGRGHALCHARRIKQLARIELARGEHRNSRVHAVLRVQHLRARRLNMSVCAYADQGGGGSLSY